RDGVAPLGDEPNGFGLELGGVGASRSGHRWTSRGEFTPLTGCPLSVGKSRLGSSPTTSRTGGNCASTTTSRRSWRKGRSVNVTPRSGRNAARVVGLRVLSRV